LVTSQDLPKGTLRAEGPMNPHDLSGAWASRVGGRNAPGFAMEHGGQGGRMGHRLLGDTSPVPTGAQEQLDTPPARTETMMPRHGKSRPVDGSTMIHSPMRSLGFPARVFGPSLGIELSSSSVKDRIMRRYSISRKCSASRSGQRASSSPRTPTRWNGYSIGRWEGDHLCRRSDWLQPRIGCSIGWADPRSPGRRIDRGAGTRRTTIRSSCK